MRRNLAIPMQLGIFAKTFSRPTLGETLDAVAGHGLYCIQFNFACVGLPTLPENIAPEVLTAIRRELAARQIVIAAVSGTFNLIHPDIEQRCDGLRRLPVLAAACARLGAPIITLCTGTRDPTDMWRRHADNDSPSAWRDLLTSLGEALLVAEAHGVTLGIEPETANVVNSARKCRRLLDELKSPRLKVVMDAANLFHPGDLPRSGEILDEAFDLLGPDIVLAHAKELNPDMLPDGRGAGRGVLDWQHYLSRLRREKFAGAVILHGLNEDEVPASVAFLQGKLSAN